MEEFPADSLGVTPKLPRPEIPETTMDTHDDLRSWRPAIANFSFLVLTLAMLVAVVFLLRGFLHAIILGGLLAILLMPVNRWLLRFLLWLSKRIDAVWRRLLHRPPAPEGAEPTPQAGLRARSLAALLSVVLVFFLVAVPLGFFVVQVAEQGMQAIPAAQKWIHEDLEYNARTFLTEHPRIQQVLERLSTNSATLLPKEETLPSTEAEAEVSAESTVSGNPEGPEGVSPAAPSSGILELSPMLVKAGTVILQWLKDCVLAILSRTWLTVFNFFIMLFVMYHVFLDGRELMAYLKSISPLGEEETRHVSSRIREVFQAIFVSVLGTAVIQGVLSMAFFKMVGVPALFWGALLGVCSIVPFVGTGLVWVPMALFLLLTGHPGKAFFILLACGGIVANVDSIIRPLLMKKGGNTGMSYMVLFFAILGGLQTFGLVGIIYGPLIMGVCGVCLLLFSTRMKRQNAPEAAKH